MPDKQILEHDRLRAIEVRVMEERERLEEANERIEEELSKNKKSKSSEKSQKAKSQEKEREEGEEDEDEEGEERILSEEEIDERCEVLRQRLLKGGGKWGWNGKGEDRRKNLKRYQVHELAEAKIEESERLRKALGIREDRETGEISSKKWERRRD
jgi:cwf21.